MPPMIIAALALTQLLHGAPPEGDRIYLAPVRAAEGIDAGTTSVIETAVLVAARQRDPAVVGSGDLAALLDLDAAKQAVGCDGATCDAELADALGAPRLLTAQISHLGDTWVLSLTLLRRDDLAVLGRQQITRSGDSADVLLPAIPDLVRDVFPAAPGTGPSPLVVAGGVAAGVGVVVAAVGGLLMGIGAEAFGRAQAEPEPQKAFAIRQDNEGYTTYGGAAVIAGVAVVVIGGAAAAVGFLAGDAP